MKKIFFMIVSIMLISGMIFTFASCKKKGDDSGKNPGGDPASNIEINFEEKSIKLNLGETYDINVAVTGAVATFSYEIQNEEILKVENNTIMALKAGTTIVKIKVVCNDEKKTTKEFSLTVEVADNREFTVHFASSIDGFAKEDATVKAGADLELGALPVIEGYEALGWSLTNSIDGERITKLEKIAADQTVYAIYDAIYHTISYQSNVESFSKAADKVQHGKNFKLGTAPTITGYTFKGWSYSLEYSAIRDKELKNVVEDTVVYAIYNIRKYTITYKLDGATYDGPTSIEYGQVITLGTPIKNGCRFLGWSLAAGDDEYITEIEGSGNITLYANFLETRFNITYVLDGGTYSGPATIDAGATLTLGTPEREGYKFLGWSLVEGSTSYVKTIEGNGHITLYANWKQKVVYPDGVYPISYDLDGGSWPVIYYTPAEIGADFMADFKESSGRTVAPSDLDCSQIESSWLGDMLSNSKYLTKWMWLLDAIWELAKGDDAYKAATADFSNINVKGFYIGNLNGFFTSTQHKDSYIGPMSENYADPDISRQIYEKGPKKAEDVGPETYTHGEGIDPLPTPVKSQYVFVCWQDASGNEYYYIPSYLEGELELVAIWEHEVIAQTVDFTNLPENGIKLYDSLQLAWTVGPDNAVNKNVSFYAMDPSIVTITEEGLVKAKSVGTGRIRVRLESNPDFETFIDISVWKGDYFDVSYEDDSFVAKDQSIKLNAAYIDKEQSVNAVSWLSLNTSIATVDANGLVTGVAEGVATIRATFQEKSFDFYVTVLPDEISAELQFVLDNHHSNAQTTYNLGIGDGNPEYYYDVVGGVSNLLFDTLKIDRRYYDKLPLNTKNYGLMTSVEFITVHYTGNMKTGADADNNCDYFNNLEYRASIHFVTGRTNLTDLTGQSSGYNEDAYYAFAGLNEKYGGWHATNADPCVWDDTGLTVLPDDPLTPVISISSNLKYTINGRETNISIPEPPSGYTVNGNVLTVSGQQYSVFNQYGLRAKVENGKYYLARTHWGTQRSPRALCTCGGNKNSIGIESCVDKGSDLEHTWHVTAQLVAKLLIDNNLGFDRVVGHHFFSGKDCPQPFLEREMKLWYEFMDMVEAEYYLLTTYQDATFTAKAVEDGGILRDNGLLVQDADAHCVTYEVTIEKGGVKQTITLATCVESYFMYDGVRQYESLQMQGYDII